MSKIVVVYNYASWQEKRLKFFDKYGDYMNFTETPKILIYKMWEVIDGGKPGGV